MFISLKTRTSFQVKQENVDIHKSVPTFDDVPVPALCVPWPPAVPGCCRRRPRGFDGAPADPLLAELRDRAGGGSGAGAWAQGRSSRAIVSVGGGSGAGAWRHGQRTTTEAGDRRCCLSTEGGGPGRAPPDWPAHRRCTGSCVGAPSSVVARCGRSRGDHGQESQEAVDLDLAGFMEHMLISFFVEG
jgi:hypothetical protein